MEIRVSLSLGYQRRRPNTQGDKLEARIDSIGLMLAGSIAVGIILWWLLPKLLAAIGLF